MKNNLPYDLERLKAIW